LVDRVRDLRRRHRRAEDVELRVVAVRAPDRAALVVRVVLLLRRLLRDDEGPRAFLQVDEDGVGAGLEALAPDLERRLRLQTRRLVRARAPYRGAVEELLPVLGARAEERLAPALDGAPVLDLDPFPARVARLRAGLLHRPLAAHLRGRGAVRAQRLALLREGERRRECQDEA